MGWERKKGEASYDQLFLFCLLESRLLQKVKFRLTQSAGEESELKVGGEGRRSVSS